MDDNIPALLPNVLVVIGLSLLPFLAVMATAFTKITIVLMMLRNAMGVQQAPSGLVINSIALTLTIFIMAPVGEAIITELQANDVRMTDWESTRQVFNIVSGGFVDYLTKFTNEKELSFFMDAARKLWPESMHDYVHKKNLFLILPAHVTSEITHAFQIAFLLFLPFVIIDMVVSNVLLAMGAMMVPPMLVSLPIKILVFIAVDGWGRLLHSLVLSYA